MEGGVSLVLLALEESRCQFYGSAFFGIRAQALGFPSCAKFASCSGRFRIGLGVCFVNCTHRRPKARSRGFMPQAVGPGLGGFSAGFNQAVNSLIDRVRSCSRVPEVVTHFTVRVKTGKSVGIIGSADWLESSTDPCV